MDSAAPPTANVVGSLSMPLLVEAFQHPAVKDGMNVAWFTAHPSRKASTQITDHPLQAHPGCSPCDLPNVLLHSLQAMESDRQCSVFSQAIPQTKRSSTGATALIFSLTVSLNLCSRNCITEHFTHLPATNVRTEILQSSAYRQKRYPRFSISLSRSSSKLFGS